MIKRDYVPHTAVNISTLYFPGSLFFKRYFPICMDYFSLLSPPGFCNCVFIPNKCIRPQPLQIGLPKSPPSALLHPQQLHRHTSAPTSSYLWKKFHHKHSSRRLHKWHFLIKHWQHSTWKDCRYKLLISFSEDIKSDGGLGESEVPLPCWWRCQLRNW